MHGSYGVFRIDLVTTQSWQIAACSRVTPPTWCELSRLWGYVVIAHSKWGSRHTQLNISSLLERYQRTLQQQLMNGFYSKHATISHVRCTSLKWVCNTTDICYKWAMTTNKWYFSFSKLISMQDLLTKQLKWLVKCSFLCEAVKGRKVTVLRLVTVRHTTAGISLACSMYHSRQCVVKLDLKHLKLKSFDGTLYHVSPLMGKYFAVIVIHT